VFEPRQQIDKRCFSAADGADQADELAGGDVYVHLGEHCLFIALSGAETFCYSAHLVSLLKRMRSWHLPLLFHPFLTISHDPIDNQSEQSDEHNADHYQIGSQVVAAVNNQIAKSGADPEHLARHQKYPRRADGNLQANGNLGKCS
jgi:hypothetical protein